MRKFNPFSVSLEGRHLVEASAGTGKTYNITSLFIRYLIEKSAKVEEILVLTYTKAATAELKERILSRLRETQNVLQTGSPPSGDDFLNQLLEDVDDYDRAFRSLETALHNFDEASIFTIHGFCQRALQEQSFLSGMFFDTGITADDSEYIREAVEDYWRKLVSRAEETETDRIWLNILRDEGYMPDKLTAMVSVGIGKPYLEIKAESPEGEERKYDLEELAMIFKEMKTIWGGSQPKIQQLLLSDAMNGNRYRKNSVPGWIEELDRWFDAEIPSLNIFDKFDRFSARFIKENGVRKGADPPEHPFFNAVEAYIEQTQRVRSWLPEFKKELLKQTRQTARERKLSKALLSYDDLLILLNEALKDPQNGTALASNLRKKFPIALVDEFQDTDPIQYEILTSIYPITADGSGLFLIGDPKQSIYSFRGADVFSYIQARSEIPQERNYGLERNFRSDPMLIHSVNKIFERLDSPFMVDEIGFEPAVSGNKDIKSFLVDGEKPPLLNFLQSESLDVEEGQLNKKNARYRAAEVTAESIARHLKRASDGAVKIGDEPVRARDIAVLVRTHAQAELVRQALERRGIKSVQYSQKSVFETDDARNMELLLKAVAEPRNEQLVRSVLATDLFPYTAKDLQKVEEEEKIWTDILGNFDHWHKIWQEQGFTPMFRTFLIEAEVEKQLILQIQGERKLTNTLQLAELIQEQERAGQGGMFELIRWLALKRKEPDKKSDEEQLRLESDEELVKLVTMHRSKGLEYPVVYCPYLWDGAWFSDSGEPFIYHDPGHENRASLELHEKGHPDRNQRKYWKAAEEISESLRLAYVAMTRAKQYCILIYEPASDIEYSALGYLLLGKQAIEAQLKEKILTEGSTSSIPVSTLNRALEELVSECESFAELSNLNEQQITSYKKPESAIKKAYKPSRSIPAERKIRSGFVISSFSSIMHPASSAEEGEVLSDEFFLPEEIQMVSHSAEERTIFSFPKGPQAGTCVHQIFEDIEFTGTNSRMEAIQENLEQFGFEEEWYEVIDNMVGLVLQSELREGVRLEKLAEKELLKEMEFYFDLQPFQRDELVRLIRNSSSNKDFFTVPEGFMKGYIDLVFRYGERFYILDYKTNYLGDESEDYREERLKTEMELAGYDVQYHIYSVALHRYLSERISGYSYDRHFGGVFYLFIRGMDSYESENGIFYDRPEMSTITGLDKLFGKEVSV